MMNPTETAATLPPREALAALNAEAAELRARLAEVERVRAATVTYLASMDVEVDDEVEGAEPEVNTEPDTADEPDTDAAHTGETRTIINETIGEAAHARLLKLLAPNADPETALITDLDVEAFRLGMRTPKARTRTVCKAFQAWACSEPMMAFTGPDVRDVITRLAMFMPPGASTVEVRRLIDGAEAAGTAA